DAAIRDFHVTGVQTCALPISRHPRTARSDGAGEHPLHLDEGEHLGQLIVRHDHTLAQEFRTRNYSQSRGPAEAWVACDTRQLDNTRSAARSTQRPPWTTFWRAST